MFLSLLFIDVCFLVFICKGIKTFCKRLQKMKRGVMKNEPRLASLVVTVGDDHKHHFD